MNALEYRHLLAAGSVVINEINYNPPDKTKPIEFIELTNPGTTAVDLSGASFTNGIHYTFPAGTILSPGGFVVVSQDPTAVQTAYGISSFGPWDGKLSNSGEDVTIVDAAGNQLDDVDYGAGFPWPTLGDSPGPGYSIELVNPSFDNSLGGNWRSYNPAAPTSVTIIAKNASWEYRKGTAEATPSPNAIGAWRGLDYVEDSNWKTGTLPIGYAPAGGPTMKTSLTDMSGGYSSVFLRKTFYIPDPALVLGLTLQAMYDDGFNVWINGRLAQVVNTPGENTAFNGLASSARSGSSSAYTDFTINPTFLQAGDNEIAVQFFNAAKTDTDGYFDAALIETTGTGGPTPGKQNSDFSANTAAGDAAGCRDPANADAEHNGHHHGEGHRSRRRYIGHAVVSNCRCGRLHCHSGRGLYQCRELDDRCDARRRRKRRCHGRRRHLHVCDAGRRASESTTGAIPHYSRPMDWAPRSPAPMPTIRCRALPTTFMPACLLIPPLCSRGRAAPQGKCKHLAPKH